jgi:exosome complex RNA-binding protein Rrp42 (RNase PH superfamily)
MMMMPVEHPSSPSQRERELSQTCVVQFAQVELTEPTHEAPREGRIEVNVEVSPTALLGKDVNGEELEAELTQVSHVHSILKALTSSRTAEELVLHTKPCTMCDAR